MSISNTASQVSYAGNGTAGPFATTFRFLDDSHLVVEVKPAGGNFVAKTLGTHYAVTGEDADAGGSVTFTAGNEPPVGSTVRITRSTPLTQETTFRNAGQSQFSPILHERALDKLTMIAQEQDRRLKALEAGSTTVALTPQTVTTTLTPADPTENSFPLNVNCAGTPVGVVLTRVENLTDGTTLPAEGLRWSLPVAGQFTVNWVEGLAPGKNYRFTFLVLT